LGRVLLNVGSLYLQVADLLWSRALDVVCGAVIDQAGEPTRFVLAEGASLVLAVLALLVHPLHDRSYFFSHLLYADPVTVLNP